MILKSIKKKLEEEGNQISNQKTTFIQKIFGGDKLKDSKLKNLSAKLSFAEYTINTSNPQNSVRLMLQAMYDYAFKYNHGVLTNEMLEMEDAIRRNFTVGTTGLPTKEDLSKKAYETIQSEMLPAVQKKGLRLPKLFYMREETKRLNEKTNSLTAYIDKSKFNCGQGKNKYNLGKAFEKINSILMAIHEKVDQFEIDKGTIQTKHYVSYDDKTLADDERI